MKKDPRFWTAIVFMLLFGFMGYVHGYRRGELKGRITGKREGVEQTRMDAMEHGVGTYILIGQTNVVWKWKAK